MKKIWIEASYILKNKTGIGFYTQKIIDILKERKFDLEILSLNLNFPYKYIWQTIWLNTVICVKTLIQKPDIIICPNFIMPFFTRKKTKYITVVHDLCFLNKKQMAKYNRFVFDLSVKIAVKKADIIVSVSETVKNELTSKYNIDADKIKVIYNSIGKHFINTENKKELLNKYNIEEQKYILSVATLNKRKNIPELINAFEKISAKYPDIKLVLAGGTGNEQREKLTKHPNVIFTGYIKDEEIPSLYKNALLYMYPSIYEGFGIPLIEAQYTGCPVLCSNIPVFREIAENSAEFCEPVSDKIAEKLEYLINNPERRKELSDLGQENIKRFSKERIEEQLMEVINA